MAVAFARLQMVSSNTTNDICRYTPAYQFVLSFTVFDWPGLVFESWALLTTMRFANRPKESSGGGFRGAGWAVGTGQLPTLEKSGVGETMFLPSQYQQAISGTYVHTYIVSNGSSVWARTSRLAGAFCLGWGFPSGLGACLLGLDMPSGLGTSRLGGGASRLGLGLPSGLGASSLDWGPPIWAGASVWPERSPVWARASHQDWGPRV